MVLDLGTDRLTIWGMTPESVYVKVKRRWDGIYSTMTTRFCKEPSEWPILYGIVLQNVILQSTEAGAPPEDIGKMAMQCPTVISRHGR